MSPGGVKNKILRQLRISIDRAVNDLWRQTPFLAWDKLLTPHLYWYTRRADWHDPCNDFPMQFNAISECEARLDQPPYIAIGTNRAFWSI
jgi:hypothetical protein